MKKKQTCKKVVNSDKSGIVASINSSVKLAKTKDRDSTSYNRVTKFSSDCVKNVCHLKKWTSVDVYRMVDGLILNQVTIQDTEKLQLDKTCFLYPNIRHELKTKWTRWLELNCSCRLWSQYFLPVWWRVIFLFFYPFSSEGRIVDKTIYTEAMFKYKKWLYGNLKIRSEATTLTRLEVRQRVLNLLRVLLTVLNAYLLFPSFLSLNEAERVDNAKDFFYN